MQLDSDEFLSDIDAIDLHSDEAQDWEHKFHIVDGDWVWTLGAFGLGECSATAVITDLCFYSGFRVGSNSERFDWSQGGCLVPSRCRPWKARVLRGLALLTTMCSQQTLGSQMSSVHRARSLSAPVRASGARASDRERETTRATTVVQAFAVTRGRYLRGVAASSGPFGGSLWRRRWC